MKLATVALADVLPLAAERQTSSAALPLWRGMLHAIVGEGESGKTWLAVHAALDIATDGGTVLVLDGEMSAPSWRRRLEALGATTSQLAMIHYAEMSADSIDVPCIRDTWQQLGARIILWDSALSLISRVARSENDNAEISRVYDKLREIIRNGPGGVVVDHSARGSGTLVSRGATAKFNALDVSYGVRIADDSIPGQTTDWATTISVEKDRHGLLGERHDRTASFHPIGHGQLHIDIAEMTVATHRLAAGNPLTTAATRIAELNPPPTSGNDAHRRIGGNRSIALKAFTQWKDAS